MRLVLICLFSSLLIQPPAAAQQDTTKFYKGLQVRAHYGFIFAHSEAVQNTAGAHPRGLDLAITRQKVDEPTWNLCKCYPTKGWNFSYFNYNNKVLGHSFTSAYFLEPAYRLGHKSMFTFRGSVGLSYLTNPYDSAKNPTNMSYSTRVSGFLQLGLGGSFQIAGKWLLNLAANYQHVSNGGLKEPNKGINWPTTSIGVTRFRRQYALPAYNRNFAGRQESGKPYFETGLFFSAKQGYQQGGKTARTPLTGVLLQVEKQVGGTSALNTGIEFYYDNALRQHLNKDSVNGSPYRVGLLAGHDFLLGRFFFSQQLGVYLFIRNPYYDRIYHRWALRYLLNQKLLLGFGLNAHRHVADFIDLRLMYRLTK